jgi:hypothetical protein
MSKNIKNLLLVLCLVGVAGQSEEAQAYSFDLAALQAVDPMTVACSIAGAAGVYTVASTIGSYFSSNGWNATAETKIFIAERLKKVDAKAAVLHSSYDLYNLSEQGLYDNINKYKNINSVRYNYRSVIEFSRELSDCIDLLSYYDYGLQRQDYDFRNVALGNCGYNFSWTAARIAKSSFLSLGTSSDFEVNLRALDKHYKQLNLHYSALCNYSLLKDVFGLYVGEDFVDVLGIHCFAEEANNYLYLYNVDRNLPYSTVVNALENCLGYLTDAGTQGLPWLKNEMKRFEPQVRAIIKFIKSSDEYRQERLAVVQSGKVWVS